MVEAKIRIVNKRGLHARAAAKLVNAASLFESLVVVVNGDDEADGKSILSLMVLGAGPGTEILVRADGPDEVEALATLKELIGGGFDEEGS